MCLNEITAAERLNRRTKPHGTRKTDAEQPNYVRWLLEHDIKLESCRNSCYNAIEAVYKGSVTLRRGVQKGQKLKSICF